MSRASSTTKICGWVPLSGIGLLLVGPFNMAIGRDLARVNLSQNMSFPATRQRAVLFDWILRNPWHAEGV
jgi:hypothetical protein